jgi:hypothetical protein
LTTVGLDELRSGPLDGGPICSLTLTTVGPPIQVRKRDSVGYGRFLSLLGEIDELELEGRLVFGRDLRDQLHRRGARCGPYLFELRHHQKDQQQVQQQRDLKGPTKSTSVSSHAPTLASFLP